MPEARNDRLLVEETEFHDQNRERFLHEHTNRHLLIEGREPIGSYLTADQAEARACADTAPARFWFGCRERMLRRRRFPHSHWDCCANPEHQGGSADRRRKTAPGAGDAGDGRPARPGHLDLDGGGLAGLCRARRKLAGTRIGIGNDRHRGRPDLLRRSVRRESRISDHQQRPDDVRNPCGSRSSRLQRQDRDGKVQHRRG